MSAFKRVVASCLVAGLTLTGLPLTAQAGIVGTDQVLATSASSTDRDRVSIFLARDDVRNALQGQGVDANAAIARVQAMSDAEVAQLASRVDQAPAGGDILGVVFTVFIVLLVTDILGLTKVFPFTRSVR
ncbi:PA2779 family protein [Acidovorax soli]|uniref:PA2779 family protein n=1 Tax=Acidovorax soli TaxID=592050 RepID=UPI0032B2B116